MSGYVNKVILIGNLGKDAESYTMSNGKKMLSFSLATSESWLDKGTNERVVKTEWHNIVIFNEQIINALESYLKKGTKVYIEGKLRSRKWVDSNRNEKSTTEVLLQGYGAVLRLLDSKKTNYQEGVNSSTEDKSIATSSNGFVNQDASDVTDLGDELADDDIPF